MESSGSKCGRVFRSLNISRLKYSEVSAAMLSMIFLLAELSLALPLIIKMFFLSVTAEILSNWGKRYDHNSFLSVIEHTYLLSIKLR